MKTALIVVAVILLVVIMVFLYLLIAGADESRKHDRYDKHERRKDD